MHGVVVVLQHELPVPPVGVPEDTARHLDLAVGRALDEVVERSAQRTEELDERRPAFGQRREQKAAIAVDTGSASETAADRLAGRPVVAAGKRQAHKTPGGVVRPAVVRADELGRVALGRLAHARPAMRAPVDEHAHGAVAVARDDDGLAPHARREEIARPTHLALVSEQ